MRAPGSEGARGEGNLRCLCWGCFCFPLLEPLKPHFLRTPAYPQIPWPAGEWVGGNTFLGMRINWWDGDVELGSLCCFPRQGG